MTIPHLSTTDHYRHPWWCSPDYCYMSASGGDLTHGDRPEVPLSALTGPSHWITLEAFRGDEVHGSEQTVYPAVLHLTVIDAVSPLRPCEAIALGRGLIERGDRSGPAPFTVRPAEEPSSWIELGPAAVTLNAAGEAVRLSAAEAVVLGERLVERGQRLLADEEFETTGAVR